MFNISKGILTKLSIAMLACAALLPVARAAPASKSLQESLKAAVVDAQSRLPELSAWQKKLFVEEVIPEYQRFVKDYRASAAGPVIEVDLSSLQGYLAYHAGKRDDLRFLVMLKPESGCDKCVSAIEGIRKEIKERVERRGLMPVFVTQKELGTAASASGKALVEAVFEHARKKNSAGALVVQWKPLAPDPDDAVHADEKRFQLESAILARAEGEARHAGELELMENDSFERALSKLMVDHMVNLGREFSRLAGTAAAGSEETLLSVSGVRDFSQYQKLKLLLQGAIKDASQFMERRISRGKAVFSVRTARSPDELKDELRHSLAGMSVDPGKLAVVGVSERTIELEIR